MQTIKIILLLLTFTLTTYANIPPQTTYNENKHLLAIEYEDGSTILYEYDGEGKLLFVETTHPDGTSTQELKNTSGLPSSKVDEAGLSTQYGYDTSRTMPLLNQVTLANNAVTHYSYDSQGKKLSQTDALSHTTSWSYTDKGQLHTETLPQGEVKTFSYDAQGKQSQITDYANKAQKFIYDSYDRLVRIELADGSTTTYAYTPSGRVKTITDSQGTIANTYDNRGRLKSQTTSTGSVTVTLSYSYDAVGNIVEIVTPQTSITKTYDALNRLKTVTDSSGVITYSYDAIGRNTTIDYSNGMQTTYEYDSRNRIINIAHTNSSGDVLQSFAYTLNDKGYRTKIVEHSGREVAYTYNEVEQLTSETITNDANNNNTTTTFTYDLVGNLLSKTIDQATTEYSYNSNDQLIQKGSTTLTYDDNGNLISQDNNTYEYDDKNRLTKVSTPTDTVEYSYDANDNRVAKIVNGDTTTYLIDTNTPYAQVITESKADGTTIDYTYGTDLLTQTIDAQSLFYLADALGSVKALANQSENITDNYTYSPYGELIGHVGTSENSFLFTGEQYDSVIDSYYLRARYYSPSLSRFLGRDTYDGRGYEPATLNHYGYAHGNPVMYVDPSGHMTMMGAVSVIGLSGVLAGSTTYALFYGGSNGQGIVGDAWDIVINSYFYNFNLSYMYYELINGEDGIEINDRTEAQQAESDIDHDNYKNKCSNKPTRGQYKDGCAYNKALLKWSKECKEAVELFDKKWKDNNRPNGHEDSWIKAMGKNIKKAEKFITKKGCK